MPREPPLPSARSRGSSWAARLRGMAASLLASSLALGVLVAVEGCARGRAVAGDGGAGGGDAGAMRAKVVLPGAPRAGMVWIPPGTLRAGTPPGRVPRIADEELAGVPVEMGGFYIDLLPYPNEAGAIPTSNVARAEAARLCEATSKRLCSELEWERACKGPDGTTYEYGDAYRAPLCGTGMPVEQSSKQPEGERLSCASGFGVRDMHGGVWEWTSSPWGRGSTNPEMGVLRGGNATAGELVGRCANAIGRTSGTKGAAMGFRCCAGAANDAKVDLALVTGVPLERSAKPSELGAPFVGVARGAWLAEADAGAASFTRAWTWHPVPNEELVIAGGCARVRGVLDCGAVVGRVSPAPKVLAEIPTGLDFPDVAQNGDARHLRIRGLELRGGFLRDVIYTYGLVDVAEKKR